MIFKKNLFCCVTAYKKFNNILHSKIVKIHYIIKQKFRKKFIKIFYLFSKINFIKINNVYFSLTKYNKYNNFNYLNRITFLTQKFLPLTKHFRFLWGTLLKNFKYLKQNFHLSYFLKNNTRS